MIIPIKDKWRLNWCIIHVLCSSFSLIFFFFPNKILATLYYIILYFLSPSLLVWKSHIPTVKQTRSREVKMTEPWICITLIPSKFWTPLLCKCHYVSVVNCPWRNLQESPLAPHCIAGPITNIPRWIFLSHKINQLAYQFQMEMVLSHTFTSAIIWLFICLYIERLA